MWRAFRYFDHLSLPGFTCNSRCTPEHSVGSSISFDARSASTAEHTSRLAVPEPLLYHFAKQSIPNVSIGWCVGPKEATKSNRASGQGCKWCETISRCPFAVVQ